MGAFSVVAGFGVLLVVLVIGCFSLGGGFLLHLLSKRILRLVLFSGFATPR